MTKKTTEYRRRCSFRDPFRHLTLILCVSLWRSCDVQAANAGASSMISSRGGSNKQDHRNRPVEWMSDNMYYGNNWQSDMYNSDLDLPDEQLLIGSILRNYDVTCGSFHFILNELMNLFLCVARVTACLQRVQACNDPVWPCSNSNLWHGWEESDLNDKCVAWTGVAWRTSHLELQRVQQLRQDPYTMQ